MTTWIQRPREIGHLLNPAFCGLLLHDAVEGHGTRQEGMSYAAAFLILPLVLHAGTRSILPKTTATRLHAFIVNNPEVKVGFAPRVRSLRPFTQEGLLFAFQKKVVSLSETGLLVQGPEAPAKLKANTSLEVEECRKYAKRLGTLFSDVDPSTLFLMWGIKP